MVKSNYNLLFFDELEKVKSEVLKPTLLLHFCCGVCLHYPLDLLSQYFAVTVYADLSNVAPPAEYEKRKETIKKVLEQYQDINFIEKEYNVTQYQEEIGKFNDLVEGRTRCHYCYFLRMKDAFAYAKDNNFAYMTTVMSISRQKRSEDFNVIGKRLSKRYSPVKYLFSDFKKDEGILKANELSAELDLYRQNYCGCRYSKKVSE